MKLSEIRVGRWKQALLLCLLLNLFSKSQAQLVTTVAGPAQGIQYPAGIVLDNNGNLYGADWSANRVYKITLATGNLTAVTSTPSSFNGAAGLAYDGSRYLYVSLSGTPAIRRIDLTNNSFITIAGTGVSGSLDGPGTTARFNYPWALALDRVNGMLYVADQENHTIRKIDLATNIVSTIAGLAATRGAQNGAGTQARFNLPTGLALAGNGQLYVADANNNVIRKIDLNNNNQVTTLAGSASVAGWVDGDITQARFSYPVGLSLYGDNILFVSDLNNAKIRKIQLNNNTVTTLAGDNGNTNYGAGDLAVDANGNLFFSDLLTAELRRMEASTALPVNFGPVSALLQHQRLKVSWQTLTEVNNDHFEVQASADGKIFKTIATIATRAKQGNADLPLNYHTTLNMQDAAGLMGMGLLCLLSATAIGTRKKWMSMALVLILITFIGYSCSKGDTVNTSSPDIYIRIAQVDKDSTTTYSKVVKAKIQ